ncbi:MAG: transcriptional regulator, LacI family [Paenibacillus sp.]|jgi:LacI family transcriptional regulator|nr:transcriptional regulator, LacI family [Paenibacillus sp.]
MSIERLNAVATLKEIADLAGVTTATVSRALNNEPGVKDSTRTKIFTIAKEMNYFNNSSAAKRAASSKPYSIGIIWNMPYGYFFNHMCLELQRQAAARGYYTLVSFANADDAMVHMNSHQVDKIIYWCGTAWKPGMQFMQEKSRFQGEMLVIGGGNIEGAHRLAVNRVEAIKKAVNYLAELGHKRIAFVGANSEKLVGYTLGLLENRLDYDADYFIQVSKGSIPEQHVANLFLHTDKSSRPTAVIVDSHGYVFPFVQIIRKLKLQVPEHFSLVAYEILPEVDRLLDVPITSVGPRFEEYAEQAIRLLLDVIPNRKDDEWIDETIPSSLNIRQSTAPPSL